MSADVLLGIMDEPVVSGKAQRTMFPYIQGILAFDTPYLGLAPGMFAHSVDAKVKSATAALSQVSALASGLFGTMKATDEMKNTATDRSMVVANNLPLEGAKRSLEGSKPEDSKADAAASPAWQRWGKLAMFAGAAGAVAAGAGAATYFKRNEIQQGFTWVSSHIEFVRELGKGETLQGRLQRISTIEGVGFANLYTSLGVRRQGSMTLQSANDATSMLLQKERTFCSEPPPQSRPPQSRPPPPPSTVVSTPTSENWEFKLSSGERKSSSRELERKSSSGERKSSSREGKSSSREGKSSSGERKSSSREGKSSSRDGKSSSRDGGSSSRDEKRIKSSSRESKASKGRSATPVEEKWYKMVNTKAQDEIEAHTGMFSPRTNPGYYVMSNQARDLIVEWVEGWN